MSDQDYTATITVGQSPMAAFAAISNPRAWWGEDIEGDPGKLGAEWSYRYKTFHYSRQRTVELSPGRRVVWHVVEADLSFIADRAEWTGTDILFDISARDGKTQLQFTHRGLVPSGECYGACSNAWAGLITGSLSQLIESGIGDPDSV